MKKIVFLNKVERFFKEHNYLRYLIVFTIIFLFFSFLQFSKSFADPDSFYHAKISVLMKDQIIVKDFNWLQFTTLTENYTDHHFLYHLFLIPFVTFFDPFSGVKIATIFFASFTIIAFYWLLQKFKIKYSLFYTLVALITSPFIFRISLAKVPALSITVLIVGLYLLFRSEKRKTWYLLFLLSFFYVWLYGGFPLIVVLTVFYMLAKAIVSFIDFRYVKRNRRLKIRYGYYIFNKFFSATNLKLLAASLGGVVAGVLASPYFPENLSFYWEQIIKIGLINYQSVIGVGGEWYPYEFFDLMSSASLVFIVWIIGLVIFSIENKRQSAKSWTLLFASFFFFIFTLKSKRNVEYFVPFTLLFSAFAIKDALPKLNFKKFWRKELKKYTRGLILVLAAYIVIAFSVVAIRDVLSTKDALTGFSSDQYSKPSQWLVENSLPGTIVFHSDWDEFPLLFYHNSKNYYIVGLDPTFMYEYDKDKYWQWVDITIGKTTDDLYRIINEEFQASYVFIDKSGHDDMIRNINLSDGFEKVYEDDETLIYEL